MGAVFITLAVLAAAACTFKVFCNFGEEIVLGLLSFFTNPIVLVCLGILIAAACPTIACVFFVAALASFICNIA